MTNLSIVLCCLLCLVTASSLIAGEGSKPAVVVELFTSEGCSSCPPADEVLAKLAKQPIDGVEIIPLAFHVDYWNRLGWVDRYSSQVFSQRQTEYSKAFKNNTIYTPQMIVNGKTEFVGSDEGKAITAIRDAAREAKDGLSIESAMRAKDGSIRVRVANVALKNAEIFVAITEDNLDSEVSRGENQGKHLTHTAVVRALKSAMPGEDTMFKGDPSWKAKDLRAVAFVQWDRSMRISAAVSLSIKAAE